MSPKDEFFFLRFSKPLKQAAKESGVSVETARRWVQEKKSENEKRKLESEVYKIQAKLTGNSGYNPRAGKRRPSFKERKSGPN